MTDRPRRPRQKEWDAAIRGRVVTPRGVIDNGVVRTRNGEIAHVGPAGRARRFEYEAAWVLPGFVDLHVHGGGGHTFTTGDVAQARAAAAFHARHGTTTMLASLVTAPFELMRDATLAYQPLIDEGVIEGLHFEGPYLSAARCGAQNPAHLRDPDPAELRALLDLGGVRMVTIAPERPGALAAIELLVTRRVIAAVGHTDATYDQTRDAIAAGARVATHLCNAMRPVHNREPGPIVALLSSPDVVCELIADGIHLHDGMLRFAAGTAGAERTALVTDAMAAAGMPDGRYELGGLLVDVADGAARLATAGTTAGTTTGTTPGVIAGSTLTMDAALRRAVHSGIDIAKAARMAATTPARVLGLDDRGVIEPGWQADLVLLDDDLHITAVLRRGQLVG